MFGNLFDPPHVKAERQIAISSGVLRQRAATNFEIEIRLLFNAMTRAEAVGNKALREGFAWSNKLGDALSDAQEFLANIQNATPAIFEELDEKTRHAVSEKTYAPLSKFEAELKDAFESLTLQARAHLRALSDASSQMETGGSVNPTPPQSAATSTLSLSDRLANLERNIARSER